MASASSSFKRAMGRGSSSPLYANVTCTFQQGTNQIRRCQSAASTSALQQYNCSLPAATNILRRNSIPSKRLISSAPTPFSRKKPMKVIPGEKVETTDIEPRASFNYQATLGMLQIARAVSPVVSMNPGFTLTSNFDLRIDGKFFTKHDLTGRQLKDRLSQKLYTPASLYQRHYVTYILLSIAEKGNIL
jgi:hypothetical protein